MLCKGQSKESIVFPIILWRFLVIYFDNYLYIFHKTKLQTVILRCWTDLNHNWFKSYDTKCKWGKKKKVGSLQSSQFLPLLFIPLWPLKQFFSSRKLWGNKSLLKNKWFIKISPILFLKNINNIDLMK